MTIKPQHCPPSKQCGCHLISANFSKLFLREKNLQSWELNPGPRGEKQVCYPLCYAVPLTIKLSWWRKSTVATEKAKPTNRQFTNQKFNRQQSWTKFRHTYLIINYRDGSMGAISPRWRYWSRMRSQMVLAFQYGNVYPWNDLAFYPGLVSPPCRDGSPLTLMDRDDI